jgi:RNA polymerase sigma factor (sigma-70 family)
VGSKELAKVTSGAREMTLAVEIQLPVNALTQTQTSLNRLIESAAAGDTAAFEQIMIHSQQKVMAMTWRILGNEADARDASQEVFLRVYKYLGRFRQDQDFFAWLYRITVNVCHDIARKRQQHSDRFMSLAAGAGEGAFAVPAEQEDAEEAFMHTQQRERSCVSTSLSSAGTCAVAPPGLPPELEATALNLRDGEKVVVGTATFGDRALIIVLTVKII